MYDELEGWLTSLGPEIGGRVVDVLDKVSLLNLVSLKGI